MRPFHLLLSVFVVNVASIAAVLMMIVPPKSPNLALQTVSIQRPSSDLVTLVSGKPVRLVIKSAAIDIATIDGEYDSISGEWTLSDDRAHYAVMTPEPNNSAGNTFIYGHNRVGVFATLNSLKPGDTASIFTDNQKEFVYTLKETKEVAATDVSLFNYSGLPILTIQTCSGTWYENRQLFTFSFSEVKEA